MGHRLGGAADVPRWHEVVLGGDEYGRTGHRTECSAQVSRRSGPAGFLALQLPPRTPGVRKVQQRSHLVDDRVGQRPGAAQHREAMAALHSGCAAAPHSWPWSRRAGARWPSRAAHQGYGAESVGCEQPQPGDPVRCGECDLERDRPAEGQAG